MNKIALKAIQNIIRHLLVLNLLENSLPRAGPVWCQTTLKSDLEPLHSFCVAELHYFVAVHKFFIWGDRSYH